MATATISSWWAEIKHSRTAEDERAGKHTLVPYRVLGIYPGVFSAPGSVGRSHVQTPGAAIMKEI
jgi:hypothetical protein